MPLMGGRSTLQPKLASTTTRKCWRNSFARTTSHAMRCRPGQHAADDGSLIQAPTPIHERTKRTLIHYIRAATNSLRLCLGLLLYWVFSGSVKEELVADGTLDRIGTLEDVSRVMEFFAGPLSGFVTGQTLIVDGGGTKL
jgi:NAD(P)-dependent dehydrogenase (short-subunit alcohol dehydrogenase family)